MTTRTWRAWTAGALAVALLGGGTGCIAYNEDCQALVENPREVVGQVSEEIYIDRPNARFGNNAIGQLAADAFVAATGAGTQLGLINGGGIRAEGVCVTRNTLVPGPMRKGVLHEVLPFDNTLSAINIPAGKLRVMLERSVDKMVATPQEITNPSGDYLHVSQGTHIDVDCSLPGGDTCTPGTCRITRFLIGSLDVLNTNPNTPVRVAMSEFLITSGPAIADLNLLDPATSPDQVKAQARGGVDSYLVEDYMRANYGAAGLKVDPSRFTLLHCTVPPRPQG